MTTAWQLCGAGLFLLSTPVTAKTAMPMDAVAAASAFAVALQSGDEGVIRSLLAPEVLIYEAGSQESSRDEYMSHHMREDMSFLAGMQIHLIDRKQASSGDFAWVATRSRLTGSYRSRPLDLYSTESLVLKRTPAGWRIVHIHWSSAPASDTH